MPEIPVQNETEYTLTTSILEQIKRDALEYFGDAVRTIRIQYGIDRHAFNARTGEMRYAFSPGDFGLVDMKITYPEMPPGRLDIPSIDDEEEVDEVPFDEVEVGATEAEPAFERLEEETEDSEEGEEAEFQDSEEEFEEMDDEDDKEYLYDDDEEGYE